MEEERFADKSVQRKQGSEDIDQERNVSTEENTFGNGMFFLYLSIYKYKHYILYVFVLNYLGIDLNIQFL